MRLRLSWAAAVGVLVRTAAAVYADDAWNVDYHLALLGAPQEHTTFFHRPTTGSKASLLYTLSSRAVLGAINPRDGSVVWRQHLGTHANASSIHLRAGEEQDIIVSGVESDITGWSASDGRQVWTVDLGKDTVKDLEVLELHEGRDGARQMDALVLSSGDAAPSLKRIDGATGTVKWTYTDDSGDTAFQVSASTTEVFLTALHTSMLGGTKVRVISLDPTNGRKTDQYTLSSDSELSSPKQILSVGANTASPIIAWTDKATTVLKVNIIGTKSTSSFNIPQSQGQTIDKVSLHAPYHLSARPHFLVHYETTEQHWAEVYHIDVKASTVSKAYSLPKMAGRGAFSTSSSDANVYFTRISESEVSVVSSASHGILGRWPVKTLGTAAVAGTVSPVHAVSEISVKDEKVSAARSAVLLSSGEWILLRDGSVSWRRPEMLASTVAAVWAFPAKAATKAHDLDFEAHSSIVHALDPQELGLSRPADFEYEVQGNQILGRRAQSGAVLPVWRFTLASDESIAAITQRPTDDPVASIGKVLGDRNVLYKYLNPNMLMITATSQSKRTASITLLDTVTGGAIFSATHQDVDLTLPISSTISENWFAYSLGVEASEAATKGFQLIVGELYESSLPNDRGPLRSAFNSSYSTFDYQPYIMTQTYNIPEPISQMDVTQTRQGITSRMLVAVLPQTNSVVGIPRSIIDPRRPVGKDPTSLEQAEGLTRYTPVLEFDPKWYLNHQRELVGIKNITTSPAIVESTSLVFAYGLDIFGTRVSPSFSFDVLGKDFNKLQMLATVFALAIGTFVVAPLVQRKQINGRWQFT